jgi:hypothetical protein
MPDPAPIRGRHWLVYELRSPFHDVEIVAEESALRGYLERGGRVEGPFVPDPDEAAIERAEGRVEDILRPYSTALSPEILAERIVEAVRAALEAPEGPS